MSAYSALILGASPNGYWRLGEPSGSVINSEVNNANMVGATTGAPTLAQPGLIGGDADTAIRFHQVGPDTVTANGTGGFGTHQTLQDVGDVFTIEAWVKRASLGTQHDIFCNGVNSFGLRFDVTTNLLKLTKFGVADIVASTVAVADTTVAHHVAATKNGATVKLYIDGVDVTGTVSNATMANPTVCWVMAADGNGNNPFDGIIDEVAFYPTALSAATILSHYQTGSGQTVAPVADVSAGSWTASAGGTLFGTIDENPASDSDYDQSSLSPASADEMKVRLAPLVDPAVGTGHTVSYRYKKNTTGGDRIDLTVTLYAANGTTVIKQWVHTAIDAVTTQTQTLSTTEADSIPGADYATGLVLGFSAIKV